MSDHDLVREMEEYYKARAPWHDQYMGYRNNEAMEELLAPLIQFVEPWLSGRDVLEIACGTGNWTQVLARRAHSVLATDISESAIAIARQKEYVGAEVEFVVADAYSWNTFGEPHRRLSGAFAADWWSHIPRSRLVHFLDSLSRKLAKDAAVIFIDMLPRDHPDLKPFRIDQEGNRVCRRKLPDGREFSVVKNFPARQELLGCLREVGQKVCCRRWTDLERWGVAFYLRADPAIKGRPDEREEPTAGRMD